MRQKTIEFQHKLPSMHIDGKDNGTYNNYEMVLPAILTTKDHELGDFLHILYNNIRDDRRLIWVDGRVLKASNNWIRDHVHEMKGTKHWEYDLKSFLLPKGKNCSRALCNGEEVDFAQGMVGDSAYVDFSVEGQRHLRFEMIFA